MAGDNAIQPLKGKAETALERSARPNGYAERRHGRRLYFLMER